MALIWERFALALLGSLVALMILLLVPVVALFEWPFLALFIVLEWLCRVQTVIVDRLVLLKERAAHGL